MGSPPCVYALQNGGAVDRDQDIGDFRDYGDSRDWTSASSDFLVPEYSGAAVSDTWRPNRVAQLRSAFGRDGLPEDRVAQATRYNPYGANDDRRFQIALVLKKIRDWVGGGSLSTCR